MNTYNSKYMNSTRTALQIQMDLSIETIYINKQKQKTD